MKKTVLIQLTSVWFYNWTQAC